ncbi:MAG: regulatory protein RecX [Gammaproteobacteria bacterium]
MPKRKTEEAAPPDARAIAARLLARREHSRAELAAKLLKRGVAEDESARVLDRLEAAGALSEARFVESFVASRLRQGYGPARIRADLAARGVAPAAADPVLVCDDAEWAARAEAARRRRFGDGIPADYAERARQARFLERRGYAAAHIARVLRGGIGE